MTVHELDRGAGDSPASAVYVYGIVRTGTPSSVATRGIAGMPVREVVHQDLVALASRVPTPVRAKRRELLSHTEVLKEAVESGPVVPLAFGITFPDVETLVSDFLEPRRDELSELLAYVGDRVELTVKAFYRPEAILAEIVRSNPRIARLREATRSRPDAATHAARLELGTAVAAELEARSRADADAILGELRPLVEDVQVDDARVEHQVLAASLLVGRRQVPAVDAAMDAIARRHADRIEFKYIGPLAPHSFVSLAGRERA